jgi:hypothetical protein
MLFKNPVRTSKRTPHFTVTKINWLTLFKFNSSLFYFPLLTILSITLNTALCHIWSSSFCMFWSNNIAGISLFIKWTPKLHTWHCLWTAATSELTVHHRIAYEYGEPRWNDIDRESRRNWRKPYPSVSKFWRFVVILSATNPTWTDTSLDGEMPATKSYDTENSDSRFVDSTRLYIMQRKRNRWNSSICPPSTKPLIFFFSSKLIFLFQETSRHL